MTKIHRQALLPYSAHRMYMLVNDVERYAEFLPWCHAGRILEKKDEWMQASIMIKKMGITKSFVTHNILSPFHKINIQLQQGPFQRLEGEWQFIPIQETVCEVILDLDVEFLPGVMNLAFKKIFEAAADSMLQAFVTRAYSLFGET